MVLGPGYVWLGLSEWDHEGSVSNWGLEPN